jgi:radical SAM superfamily enzyme YgiQ (UPF0313 family)
LASLAGCKRWYVGVESGSERVRFDMKKDITDEDLDHCIVNLYNYKISQNWLLMVGYPTEFEEDYLATEQLIKRYASLNKTGTIKLNITPTFQLLSNSPLLENPEYVTKYGLKYDTTNSNLSRYFWTADINPENTFPVRVDRFLRFLRLATDLGYEFQKEMPIEKWIAEVQNLTQIYNDYTPKKVFTIATD